MADRVATEYVGGLRDLCHRHGLQLWLENYGHWGFPGEFLQYGSQSDRVGGEFWVTGDLGSIECRAASSAARTAHRPITAASPGSASAIQGTSQRSPAAIAPARAAWSVKPHEPKVFSASSCAL